MLLENEICGIFSLPFLGVCAAVGLWIGTGSRVEGEVRFSPFTPKKRPSRRIMPENSCIHLRTCLLKPVLMVDEGK